jgi:hypothetical protein
VTGWEEAIFEKDNGDNVQGTVFSFQFSRGYYRRLKEHYELFS